MAESSGSRVNGRPRQKGRRREGGPPFWEWTVAGVGLVMFVATLGYLTFDALAPEPTSPSPRIEVTSVESQDSRFLVHLRVHNAGKTTAAGLRVSGILKSGGEVLERSATEFEYIPGESSRSGGLFFSRDPSRFQLELRAESFRMP